MDMTNDFNTLPFPGKQYHKYGTMLHMMRVMPVPIVGNSGSRGERKECFCKLQVRNSLWLG